MSRSLRIAPLLLCLVAVLYGCESTPVAPSQPPATTTGDTTPAVTEAAPAEAPAAPQPAVEPPPAVVAPVEIAEPVPAPVVQPVCRTPAPPKPAKPERPKAPIPILGGVETVLFDPPGVRLDARLDTGRSGSQLHARDVREFERDGKQWVKFHLTDQQGGQPLEVSRPVVKKVADGAAFVYTVTLRIRLGTIDQFTEFALVDRAASRYPVLLGARFLRDQALVDVARDHTVPPPGK